MMTISTRGRYATRMVVLLAAQEPGASLTKSQIADAEGLTLPDGGKATYKWQAGATRVDTDLLKAVYPEVYAAVSKQGADMRVLRLPRK